MIKFTNEQDFQNFDGGYKSAMLTVYLALDNLLEDLEDDSATLESAKRKIKLTKEFCLDEFLNEKENFLDGEENFLEGKVDD